MNIIGWDFTVKASNAKFEFISLEATPGNGILCNCSQHMMNFDFLTSVPEVSELQSLAWSNCSFCFFSVLSIKASHIFGGGAVTNLYISKQNSIYFLKKPMHKLIFTAVNCATQNVSTASPSHSRAKMNWELLTKKWMVSTKESCMV